MSIPKIVIHLEGGLVQWVYGDSPVDVLIMDLDTEGADADEITQYKDMEGENAEAVFHFDGANAKESKRDKAWVEQTFKTVIKDHAKKAEEELEGTEGQDRHNYTDTQDRENYTTEESNG